MAWEARLGLKPFIDKWLVVVARGQNGLGSPSGIETCQSCWAKEVEADVKMAWEARLGLKHFTYSSPD